MSRYHLLASVSHGKAITWAMPARTLVVLAIIVALSASRHVRNCPVGQTTTRPDASISIGWPWSSLKPSMVAMACLSAALHSATVGSSAAVASYVSLLSCWPLAPDSCASLKKETPS